MPDEFYFVIASVAALIAAFVWLVKSNRRRIDNPRPDEREGTDPGGGY